MAKQPVMLCTAGRGGMLSVVERYQADGLFSRWNVRLLSPHEEGSLSRRLWVALRALLIFCRELLLRRVSLLHCHVAMAGSFWRKSVFAWLAFACRVPVIFHLHGSDLKPWYAAQSPFLQKCIRSTLEHCSAVLVLSDSWADYIHSLAPTARVQVLPNYVELPSVTLSRQVQPVVNILFLGIIGERKGVFDLLPAFAQARAIYPFMRLQIGGNGELEQARRQAEALGLAADVDFLGWVGGAERDKLLAEADLMVLPSYNEGLPISLLEAMAWSLPIISTRVGGIPELVSDGVSGLLLDAGDIDGLRDALLRLALDASLRKSMGQAGRLRVASTFSRAAVLPVLEALYAKLTGKPHFETQRQSA
ncbi:glycosyltransferase family 4 protein [Craterilacuibacter sp. RT1T]|uniref:glycosyltransferase family 4 protein n=1 Tax=Craterilacuibacter sp. RT1T TaxID=2942211 RepID=UPI0020C15DB4|nr:glycosyltransferase family 4 protein [Craterilacuibacter sp. RT1T]MCL6262743.1 glycosyltransferase family 4 protein [Craterilacuibacter sp. RT1T]